MTTHAGSEPDTQRLLAEHHRATEDACTALLARTYADDPLELVGHYRVFEHALLDHLALEERVILPRYAEHAPDDARRLREDHASIRKALERLGIEVELHCVRAHSVNELVDTLRAHAEHEDAAMYPWAQTHLERQERDELSLRVDRSLHDLATSRHRRVHHTSAIRHTGYTR